MDKVDFIRESNLIEGIYRDPTDAEIDEFDRFISLDKVRVHDLERFVSVYQRNAVLRRQPGLNVRLGEYVAPSGGPLIQEMLTDLLRDIEAGLDPWDAHVRYETLHPFSDGNGRSGRMLWAWQVGPLKLGLGFLHQWYYDSLSRSR